MNGWQKLWVIGCVLAALTVFMMGMSFWPSSASDNAIHEQNVKSNELQLSIIKTAMEYPESSPGLIDENHNIDQINFAISQEAQAHKERASTLWSRQVAVLLMFFAIWVAVCGLLYIIGMMGAWVMKGFQPKKV
ncbi:hypothetical protein [Pseudomonas jessenii]|uniref:hypothetical protein n=1 Tax=Pseudomonas jessenii TaxID=77298 RepID=UPI0030BAE18A